MTEQHRLCSLDHRNLSSPPSGVWKARIGGCRGFFLPESLRESLVHDCLLVPGTLLMVLSIPHLRDTASPSLPPSLQGVPPGASLNPNFPLFKAH